MMRRASLVLIACLSLAALATPRAAAKRPITETDLFKFTWIADPQVSPDGSAAAFVRVVVNEKENRYETSIFTAPVKGAASENAVPRRLTSGIRDSSPRWSPDGTHVAFIRSVEKDGKAQPGQIYLLPMNGGEARPLTDVERGASGLVWSPDGKTIAFLSAAGPKDGRDGSASGPREESESSSAAARASGAGTPRAVKNDVQEGPEEPKGHKSDVKIITRAVYRANGNPGYVDVDHHIHIFTVAIPDDGVTKPEARQMTDGEFDEHGIQWATDGSAIYFTSNRVAEAYYEPQDSDLYRLPAAGGPLTKIASIEGTISDISLSHDGKRVAFIGTPHGNPVRSYSQPDVWVADASPGSTPRNLTTSYDFDIGGGIGGDQAAPRGEAPKPIVWSRDDSSLVVVSAEHGSANLERITIASGRVERVTDGNHDVMSYTATPDGETFASVVSTQTNIGDLSVIETRGTARVRQVTRANDDLFKDIAQSEPEELWYTSFDGRKIQGWIVKPPDFDASRKYPMILEIHGGPHSAYGNTYTHEFMWMAAKGYVVLFINPRGSTSYGQEFGNIIQYHYPGDDYKDLMAGVDEVLKRGYVDANRLGVTGGSGGGLLTNWTITQTQRFKAAVAQRDIADWYGFWFTADFTLFQPTWFRKAPWEDPQDYAARSPITHIANVTTPLMLVNGDADYRTPPADGGEMMFRALKYRKIPTVMVRFPRENHELSRSGEPWHRVERLRHIVGWMDQWLQGKKNEVYQTP